MNDRPNCFLTRFKDADPYSPGNHTGTLNRRLAGPGVMGGAVEVVHGTIQPGGGALPHRHEGIEQVCYVISGLAEVEVCGETFRMYSGDCCRFPPGEMHRFTALGDAAVQVLVIYSPPYGEPS